MTHPETQRVVILGGGTAGWMAAACLSKIYGRDRLSVTLVESADIGTVGVGEATIPMINLFNTHPRRRAKTDLVRETAGDIQAGH